MYKLFEIVAYCSFNTVCSKVCIQNDPVDRICAAHKRKREAEMKLRDQIVTLGLFFFFWPTFSAMQQGSSASRSFWCNDLKVIPHGCVSILRNEQCNSFLSLWSGLFVTIYTCVLWSWHLSCVALFLIYCSLWRHRGDVCIFSLSLSTNTVTGRQLLNNGCNPPSSTETLPLPSL